MSDTNPAPAAGNDAPLSLDDGVEALTDLLPDPETDLAEEDQGQEATEEAEDQPEETAEATEEETEEPEGQQDYESGKFAADTANVRLKDGTVISVQELKRGWTSQQSFTRGTQENAREREALASQKAEYEQHARSLAEQRELVLKISQQLLPQPPDPALLNSNSAGYDPLRYMQEKDDYDRKVGSLTQLHQAAQAEQARMAQEQQRMQKEMRDKEAKLLVETMPELKKPEVYNKFWSDAVDVMADYGYSAEELAANATDHRLYPIFRDLAAYRRARKNLPAVKQAVQSKPVLTGQKRMDPKTKVSREQIARKEQLRKTGDFDAGVSALMDLDL